MGDRNVNRGDVKGQSDPFAASGSFRVGGFGKIRMHIMDYMYLQVIKIIRGNQIYPKTLNGTEITQFNKLY